MIAMHIKGTSERFDTNFKNPPRIGEIIAYNVGTGRHFYEVIGVIHNCKKEGLEVFYLKETAITIELVVIKRDDMSHLI